MLTINAEIKRGEQKLNGTYNVKLRLTLDRKVKRLSTSLFATPKDLTKDMKIKQSSPLKREVDNLLRAYQEKCAKLQIELNHYTIDDVVDYLNGEHEKEQTIDNFLDRSHNASLLADGLNRALYGENEYSWFIQ